MFLRTQMDATIVWRFVSGAGSVWRCFKDLLPTFSQSCSGAQWLWSFSGEMFNLKEHVFTFLKSCSGAGWLEDFLKLCFRCLMGVTIFWRLFQYLFGGLSPVPDGCDDVLEKLNLIDDIFTFFSYFFRSLIWGWRFVQHLFPVQDGCVDVLKICWRFRMEITFGGGWVWIFSEETFHFIKTYSCVWTFI